MDDLIEKAGIDAKHSNEDQIAHFSKWVELYGERIGNFGGIDTDVLCRKFSGDHSRIYSRLSPKRSKGHGHRFQLGQFYP